MSKQTTKQNKCKSFVSKHIFAEWLEDNVKLTVYGPWQNPQSVVLDVEDMTMLISRLIEWKNAMERKNVNI